jgi:hypothetical protein
MLENAQQFALTRYINLSRDERIVEQGILFYFDLQGSQVWCGNKFKDSRWGHRNIFRHKAVLVLSATSMFASWFNVYSCIRTGQRRWILKREKHIFVGSRSLFWGATTSICLQQVEGFRDFCNSSVGEFLFWRILGESQFNDPHFPLLWRRKKNPYS